MTSNLISIIVPCFNQAEFLDEALQSVIDQKYENWECIIVNDGSSDNTADISKLWCNKDARFNYIEKENGGLCAARNTGIEMASGEYILPLDADDKISSNYIMLAVREFQKDNALKVIYCRGQKFGIEDGMLSLTPFSLYNLSRNCMIFCSAVFRKEDWDRIGGYDVNMKYGWEDWEFWISLLKNGGGVKRIEKVCFYYRIKKVSMLKSVTSEQGKYLTDYMSIKHADFFVRYYGSFFELTDKLKKAEIDFNQKINSEKFILNIFSKKFFGFSLFNTS